MGLTENLKWVLSADATQFGQVMSKAGRDAERDLGKAETAMDKVSGNLTKVGAGAVAFAGVAGVALVKTAFSFQDLALASNKFSLATGLSVSESSRWIEVAKDMGLSGDTVQGAIGKMSKALATNTAAFAENGVEIARNKDGTENIQQTFLNAIDRLKGMTSETEKTKLAAQLFGRSWQDMAELINVGSDGLKASLAAVAGSKVITDEQVVSAKAFRADLDTLKDSLENIALSIGKGVMPAIGGLAAGIGHAVDAFGLMNGVTDGALGKFLAIGTAAIGAAGALTFIAGKASALKDALVTVNEAGKLQLTTMGGLGLAIGAAAIAYQVFKPMLSDVDKAVIAVKHSMDEGSKSIDVQKIAYETAADAAREFGKVLFTAADAALTTSISKNKDMVAVLDKLNISLPDVVNSTHDYATAQAMATKITDAATAAGIAKVKIDRDGFISGSKQSIAVYLLAHAIDVQGEAAKRSLKDNIALAEVGDLQATKAVKASGAWGTLTEAQRASYQAVLDAAAGQAKAASAVDAGRDAAEKAAREAYGLGLQQYAAAVATDAAAKATQGYGQGLQNYAQEAAAASLSTAEIAAAFKSSAEEGAKAEASLTETLENNAKALQDDAKAMQDLIKSAEDLAGATEDLSKATDEWNVFLDGEKAAIDEVNKSKDSATVRQAKLNDIYREGIDKAKAIADARVAERVAQDQLNGVVTTATTKIDLQNQSMINQAAQAKGPTRDAILGFIGDLNGIPKETVAKIKADLLRGDIDAANADLAAASRTRTAGIIADADTVAANKALDDAARTRNAKITVTIANPSGSAKGNGGADDVITPKPGQAGGGTNRPGDLTPVVEGGKSELLHENGKTYLLSGSNNRVEPLGAGLPGGTARGNTTINVYGSNLVPEDISRALVWGSRVGVR